MGSTNFRIKDLSCANCENTIQNSVEKLTGVNGVTISKDEKSVTVQYDPSLISAQKLRETIEHIGFDVIS